MSGEVLNSLIGVAVGFLLSQVADFLSTRRARKDRWKELQRESILEAQDLITTLYRLERELVDLRLSISGPKLPGMEGSYQTHAERVTEADVAMVRLMVLRQLINDQDLNARIGAFQERLLRKAGIKPGKEDRENLKAASKAAEQAYIRIREVLPTLY